MLKALIESIQQNFEQESDVSLSRDDAIRKSTAALLVEISRSDHEIQPEELLKIREILIKKFELDEVSCQALLDESQDHVEDSVSLHEFTRLLNDHLSREERTSILGNLWQVAFADGVLDKHEEYTIRKIADLLYVSQKDFIQTKLKVSRNS